MTQSHYSSMSELFGLVKRGLTRLCDEHVYDLGKVIEASLVVIHPNERRSARESLELFTAGSVATMNVFLQAVVDFVLATVKNTSTTLTAAKVDELVSLVHSELRPDLYLAGFDGYESAFARRIESYGSTMHLSDFRSDLSRGALHAATANRVRAFRDQLKDYLLTELERQENMSPLGKAAGEESLVDQANRFIKFEPNFMGIGFNFNYLIRLFRGKKE